MTVDPADIQVLIPGTHNELALVGLVDLANRLEEGAELDEAIDGAAIDTVTVPRPGTPGTHVRADEARLKELLEHLHRVDALNRTGDADAYWNHR